MKPLSLRSTLLLAPLLLTVAGCNIIPLSPAFPDSSGEYEVDSGHSAVVFQIRHLGVADFYGRFNQVRGKIVLDLDDANQNSLVVKVPTSSLDTNNKERDEHVLAGELLNVAGHPEIKFVSTSFDRVGPSTYLVTGDLSFLGQTKRLTVDLEQLGSGKDPWGGFRTGFHTSFQISRSDFGMTANANTLGDVVTLYVTLEARRTGDS